MGCDSRGRAGARGVGGGGFHLLLQLQPVLRPCPALLPDRSPEVQPAVHRSTQLAFLDLAAKACPRRVEATFFALLMSVFNGGMQVSQITGGYLYDWLGYTPLVLISAAMTALAWLLVPLVRIDLIAARAREEARARTAATCSRRIAASSSPFPGFAESVATTVSTFTITFLPPRRRVRLASPSRARTGASGARARRRPVPRCRPRSSRVARSAGGDGCARRRAPAPGRPARGGATDRAPSPGAGSTRRASRRRSNPTARTSA